MSKKTKLVRIGFGGVLPDHKRIPDAEPGDSYGVEMANQAKWVRANQKRELAAYLKGHTRFRHGGNNMSPMMFDVRQRVKEVPA